MIDQLKAAIEREMGGAPVKLLGHNAMDTPEGQRVHTVLAQIHYDEEPPFTEKRVSVWQEVGDELVLLTSVVLRRGRSA